MWTTNWEKCCTKQFKGGSQIETSAVQDSLKVDPNLRQELYRTVQRRTQQDKCCRRQFKMWTPNWEKCCTKQFKGGSQIETNAVQESLKMDPNLRQVLYKTVSRWTPNWDKCCRRQFKGGPPNWNKCCTRQFKGGPQIETSAVQNSLKVDPKFRQVLYKTV